MNRFAKGSRFVVLALAASFTLLLSGCFRPAGDTIQPTSGSGSDTSVQPLGGATATAIPAITLLSPDTSGATATQPAMAITEVTLAPATVAVATEAATESGPVTATLQIITPGISLGLLTPDTPIPGPTELPPLGDEATGTEEASISAETGDTTELVSGDDCTYTVEPGDSLYLIAINNDTTIADIQAVNDDLVGAQPVLQIGQVIRMPDCEPGVGTSENETSPTEAAPETEDESTPLPGDSQTYRVQPGDTLLAIANRFGVTVNAIARANNLSNPNDLDIGQELIIPAPAE